MKRMVIALLLLALATPVLAQDAPPARQPAKDQIVRFLELDAQQVELWDQLLAGSQAAAEPIRQDLREVEEQLRALLEEEQPDLAAVGELVVNRRDLGRDLAAAHRDYLESFANILDEEQQSRLGFVRRAERAEPLFPAFRAFGLLSAPGPR